MIVVDSRYASLWEWCPTCGEMKPVEHKCTNSSVAVTPLSEQEQEWEREKELAKRRGFVW